LMYQAVSGFLTQGDLLPLSFMRALSMYYTLNNSNAQAGGGISAAELAGMWRFDRGTTLVFNNMGTVLRLPEALAGIVGSAMRLAEFAHGLEYAASLAPTTAAKSTETPRSDRCISANGIDVVAPKGGEVLALTVSFEVKESKAMIITGPNATGKSLLANCIAGLRPLISGEGSVVLNGVKIGGQRPHLSDLLLIPQRAYLAPGGLGDQVSYPLPGAEQDPGTLQRCLDIVGIGYLVQRHGSLQAEPELPWDEILSGGEQQRIGMARCIFHKPGFAILDECSSMVSQDAEQGLYKAISEVGTIPITVSQRLSLPEMHSQELRLGCETVKGWSLETW